MIKFKGKFDIDAGYSSWYLLPTIRFGTWEHPGRSSKEHGGFLALTWLKGDACLSWTIKD